MALNIPGLVATIVFYAITLATGIWAAWKTKKEEKNANRSELAMVGGRKMNIFVGLFTATATWIGGGYINGTAEIVYVPTRGLVWVLAPVGYVLAFIIGGLFFVKPMRSKSYVTMMDPLQATYGNTMGTLLFLPALIGDVFWFAAILSALGCGLPRIRRGERKCRPVIYQAARGNRLYSYVTMMDPLQATYGNTMGTLLFLPALIGDVFWFAAILSALGATMSVILDIREYLAIIISACTVILYTLPGGLYSVAYTDVIQLVFMVVSLWTCVPFALLNPATESIYYTAVNEFYQVPWIGKLETEYLGRWLDELLYVALGSIPWQIYFQRVLAASSSRQARLAFYFAGFGCVFMAIPCVLIGAVAASTDWNQTSYGLPTPNERGESSMILPIVLQYLCPTYVSVAGLGAIAAAVMSSADSALLSASSMLAHNIYRKILRKKATEKEVVCIMRVSMVVFGAAAAGLAFLSNSVYDLWFLSGELVYALLFPQLCCVLFIPNTNTYGSAAGFLFGFLLRLLAGEPSLKIPPVIHYPGCSLVDGVYIQLFPFKTFTMLLTLGTIVAVSYLVAFLFNRNILPHEWDVCSIIKESEASVPLPEIDEQAGLQINTVYINPTEIHT